jgi:hypothetical protein
MGGRDWEKSQFKASLGKKLVRSHPKQQAGCCGIYLSLSYTGDTGRKIIV